MYNQENRFLRIFLMIFLVAVISVSYLALDVTAQNVPDWVKNTALWYGEGQISESEFINAIKFLLKNKIIVIESDEVIQSKTVNVVIPNGNSDMGNAGFYLPLNAQIKKGTTVVWINDDAVPHTIQSQDEKGNVIGLFNSALLNTGDRFPYTFNDEGVYNYFCTLHPWRVGVVTVE